MLKMIVAATVALMATIAQAATQERSLMETVAVIGTGRMGGAFGSNLAALGHPVIYGSRDPQKQSVKDLVAKTKSARAMSPKDAAAASEIIVLAVPWNGIDDTLASLGNVNGKIVMDATNAIKFGQGGMEMAGDISAGEHVQARLAGAKVVKAFNTVGFFVIADPKVTDGPVASFLAGEDAAAKARVSALVTAMGFQPVDVGGIKNARVLEGMSILYMVPYLGGRRDLAFEWAIRGTGNRAGGAVRPAN